MKRCSSLGRMMQRCVRAAVCAALLLGSRGTFADENATTELAKDLAWVQQRVADWQPTQAERAFEDIGWTTNLLEAQRLAQQHGRGIFLFTYDGASLSGYRC